ncbi:MAG: hypothetical protein WAL49_11875, partial [Pseudolabrys sp.]
DLQFDSCRNRDGWRDGRRDGALILTLAHLLDGDPVLQRGQDIKLLYRLLDSLALGGGLNGAEAFRTMTKNIDTPAGHLVAPSVSAG